MTPRDLAKADRLIKQLEVLMPQLSKNRAEKVLRIGSQARKRFIRCKAPKYGTLARGFTDAELQRFMKAVDHPTALMVFQLMANLGLSVCEACELKAAQVNLSQHEILILSKKGRNNISLRLHGRIYPELRAWMNTHKKEIAATGRLFPPVQRNNAFPHISPGWIAKKFREASRAANLESSYGNTLPCGAGNRERPMHRLTTHSLRHYFITRVYRSTKDPVLTQKLARHVNPRNTGIYIGVSRDELDQAIDQAFGGGRI